MKNPLAAIRDFIHYDLTCGAAGTPKMRRISLILAQHVLAQMPEFMKAALEIDAVALGGGAFADDETTAEVYTAHIKLEAGDDVLETYTARVVAPKPKP